MAGHAKFLQKPPAPASRGARIRETAPQTRVDAPRLASPSSTGAPAASDGAGTVQTLQRLAGNQAVMRMLDVQRAAGDLREPSNKAIRAAAIEGVRTPSTSLPYLDRIQASFGRHSIGDIQAHVGSAAARSSQAMSARAYATGNHVVFGARPALRTAAHEAAHIVQQRAGVQLAGGIGRVGDPYERHADAVADAVVAGRSAEGMLEPFASEEGRYATYTSQDRQNTTAVGVSSGVSPLAAPGADGVNADPALEAEARSAVPRVAAGAPAPVTPQGSGAFTPAVQRDEKYETEQDKIARELAELRARKLVQGKRSWFGFGSNPAHARDAMLSQHLVETGRAADPNLPHAGEIANSPKNEQLKKTWAKTEQAREKRQRDHNLQVEAQRKAYGNRVRRNLTDEENKSFDKQKVLVLAARPVPPSSALMKTGAPDEAIREDYSEMILDSMERSTNLEKLRRATGFDEEILSEHSNAEIEQQLHDQRISPAHFFSRHGAQSTRSDQAARVAAGYAADQKPGSPPTTTVAGPVGSGIRVPTYPLVGPGAVPESSRFGSHVKQLSAIREAYAQVWNQRSESLTKPWPFDQPVLERREVGTQVPIINEHTGQPVLDAHGVQRTRPQYNWNESMVLTSNNVDPTGRLEVNLGRDMIGGKRYGDEPEGYGESVSMRAGAPPLRDRGQPLPKLELATRTGALQVHREVPGAQLFMDVDPVRGGFTVQTAYPQRNPDPGLTAMYLGEHILTRRVIDHANVETPTYSRRDYRRKLKRVND